MNIIIETDLGHDPDDFFAICWLVAVGVNPRLLLINPGSPDQLAFAKFLMNELGFKDTPICAAKETDKMSSGSVHHELLRKYKQPLQAKFPAHAQPAFIEKTLKDYPDSTFFIIGPPKCIGHYLKYHDKPIVQRCTMQGGFLPYHLHDFPAQRLDKFVDQYTVPTFNMNGAPSEIEIIINSSAIAERQFVGKNVCHTVVFDKQRFNEMAKPSNRAAELFMEGMGMYLTKHSEKKFHDPLAAFLHVNAFVGQWVYGKPFREKGKWGTHLTDQAQGDKILADLDRKTFWEMFSQWSMIKA